MKKFKSPPIGIMIHHSAVADNPTANDTEAYKRYHVKANGWDTIGYHAVTERYNGIVKTIAGRSEEYQGAHCPDVNATHLGICIAGNFDVTTPDADLMAEVERHCRYWMKKYNIPAHEVTYHCRYSTKTCPGKKFPQSGFLLALAGEKRP